MNVRISLFFVFCSIASLHSAQQHQHVLNVVLRGNIVSAPIAAAVINAGSLQVTMQQTGSAAAAQSAQPDAAQQQIDAQLFEAAEQGNKELVSTLLGKRANVNTPGRCGMRPLHVAVSCGHLAVVNELIAHGANLNSQDDCGCTVLKCAVNMGFFDVAQALIRAGAVASVDTLYVAIQSKNVELVRLLATHVDVNSDAGLGCPLMCALSNNLSEEGIHALLTAGAEINYYDKTYNLYPLHHAVMDDTEDTGCFVKLLLERGALPNVKQEKTGMTPLWLAACFGRLRCAELLLAAGASPLIKGFDERRQIFVTPEELALSRHYVALAEKIRTYPRSAAAADTAHVTGVAQQTVELDAQSSDGSRVTTIIRGAGFSIVIDGSVINAGNFLVMNPIPRS